MKLPLVAALVLTLAPPVAVSMQPTPAEAQVLVGRSAARPARAPRPALSERELERLYAAQDEVLALTQQIDDLNAAAAAAGSATAEQAAQLQAHQTRLGEQQAIVDRLEAKRNRARS